MANEIDKRTEKIDVESASHVERKDSLDHKKIRYEAPYFSGLLVQNGGKLPRDLEAHALWHYYITASESYMKRYKRLRYVGDPTPDPLFWGLFKAIADIHQVDVNKMYNYWPSVVQQAEQLFLLPPPTERGFRGDKRNI